MNRDLERQLDEMGAEYRVVVDRLVGAYAPATETPRTERFRRGWLVAASLLVLLAAGAVLLVRRPPCRPAGGAEYTLAYQRTDAAVREMIRTQNPDGSWKNDFLTRQNAAALRLCGSREAGVAYRKALRNLRAKGLL